GEVTLALTRSALLHYSEPYPKRQTDFVSHTTFSGDCGADPHLSKGTSWRYAARSTDSPTRRGALNVPSSVTFSQWVHVLSITTGFMSSSQSLRTRDAGSPMWSRKISVRHCVDRCSVARTRWITTPSRKSGVSAACRRNANGICFRRSTPRWASV